MKPNVAPALSQIMPFQLLTRQELERAAAHCTQRSLSAGEMVYSDDEWLEHLWILTEGFLRVSVLPAFGGHSPVGIMKPGELVGCLNGVCRHKHPTEGLALTDCSFIVLPRQRYLELLGNKDFSLGIVHILGERLWDSQLLRAASTQDSDRRLAWTLLWLHGKIGRRIPMTRRLIAETAGVARETSIRILSPLEKKGWIKTRRGLLEVLRPDKLKESLDSR